MKTATRITASGGWLPVAAGVLLLLASCSRDNVTYVKMDPGVVAEVNGLIVTLQELDDRFGRLQKELEARTPGRKEDDDTLKKAILQELVNRKLLLSEAQHRRITVSAEEVEKEKSKFTADLSLEELRDALDVARMTPESLEESIREDLLITRVMDSLSTGITVPEQEIVNYYEENKGTFYQQESVRARHLIVNRETDAKRVRKRLAAKEDFAVVAREVSVSPDAQRGGDLGYFQRGQMPKELEDVAFSMMPGQISEVIETPYGFHLLKLEEKLPAKQLELAEVRGKVISALTSRKKEENYKKLLSALWEKAQIKYNKRHGAWLPKKRK